MCERIRAADLVITGEGALDRSSLMGKGVGEIAQLCQQYGIPCLGLAGRVEDPACLEQWFNGLYSLVPEVTTQTRAQAESHLCLERLTARIACEWARGH